MNKAVSPSSPGPAVAALIGSSAFVIPALLGASTAPSPNHPRVFLWYRTLRMPPFKPKDWVIPAAWFGIEAALATSTYRLVRAAPSADRTRALGWMAWNVVMIGSWSRLFFGRRSLPVSTFAAASMVASGIALVAKARKVDAIAGRTALPLAAWVSFATVLTASIWALNRRR